MISCNYAYRVDRFHTISMATLEYFGWGPIVDVVVSIGVFSAMGRGIVLSYEFDCPIARWPDCPMARLPVESQKTEGRKSERAKEHRARAVTDSETCPCLPAGTYHFQHRSLRPRPFMHTCIHAYMQHASGLASPHSSHPSWLATVK
jgi:hypothetical protein